MSPFSIFPRTCWVQRKKLISLYITTYNYIIINVIIIRGNINLPLGVAVLESPRFTNWGWKNIKIKLNSLHCHLKNSWPIYLPLEAWEIMSLAICDRRTATAAKKTGNWMSMKKKIITLIPDKIKIMLPCGVLFLALRESTGLVRPWLSVGGMSVCYSEYFQFQIPTLIYFNVHWGWGQQR